MPETDSIKIIRSDRRTLALEMKPDGTLIVRAPQKFSHEAALTFINKHMGWIEKTRQKMARRMTARRLVKFEEGEFLPYLGKEYPMHIAEDMFGKLLFEDRFILSARYQPKARRLFERWYKHEAFSIFTQRCEHYSKLMNVRTQSIDLSNASAQWGSCNPGGRLRFNWRLVMAPIQIIDYVVVHELSHLKEHNHSKRFWELVGIYFPDYRVAKKWLKENALSLAF